MMEHVSRGHTYAQRVVTGKVIACEWIKLACENYLLDLKSSAEDEDYPYYFCEKSAERVLNFKQAMPHTKGEWAKKGLLLELEDWQCFFNMNVFGWKRRSDDLRRYRKAILFVPRKNGKSAEASTTGLYMLAADGEHGAEVYSGATTEKQAHEVFLPAKIMASKEADFRDYYGVQVNAKTITVPDNGGKFECLIGNPNDGSSPSCAIIDELHEHKDARLYETMETGMGAREQPLILIITTAGDNISGICYQMIDDAEKMLRGTIKDDETFAMLYTIDKDDDWKSEEALRKANPNYDVSIKGEFLKARQKDAINSARKQSAFKTKHLNIWVGSHDAFFNMEEWMCCEDASLTMDMFVGQRAFIGLDLASKKDITALDIYFPDALPASKGDDKRKGVTFCRSYLNEEVIEENPLYQGWMIDGWITETMGNITDYAKIESDIVEFCKMFEVIEVAYDPFQATMLVTRLIEQGIPMLEIRPTPLNFSEPMKELEALIKSGRIRHNGDKCFSWMMSNVVAYVDVKDNVYPRKDRAENKIDGPISLIMAIGAAMRHDNNPIDFDNLLMMRR